jgi:hypothetical protein
VTVTVAAIPLGRVVMTRSVAALVAEHQPLARVILAALPRHARGECPAMSEHDQRANAMALVDGSRMFTSWPTGIDDEPTAWVITEADRSSTCVLLPSDY